MGKCRDSPSSDDVPRCHKRKAGAPGRSAEDEAEEEAEAKWGCKKVKTEPGLPEFEDAASKPHATKCSTKATDALRKKREASSASVPRTGTPAKHEDPSVIDCALKVLAEVRTDDDSLVPAAIKTFTEDHLNSNLPTAPVYCSKIPWVRQQLADRRVEPAQMNHVSYRLRQAEAIAVASWLSSAIHDRDTLENACHQLLGIAPPVARPVTSSVRTPQPTATHAARGIPTPPSSSRTSSGKGAGKQ